jgi:hypothetical protein
MIGSSRIPEKPLHDAGFLARSISSGDFVVRAQGGA